MDEEAAQAMRNHISEKLYDVQPPCVPPGRIAGETNNSTSRTLSNASKGVRPRRLSRVKNPTVKQTSIIRRTKRDGQLSSIKLRILRFVRQWGPKCLEHDARFVVLYSEKSTDNPDFDRPDVIPLAEDVAHGRFANLSEKTKKILSCAIRTLDRDHPTLLKPKEPTSDDEDDDDDDADDEAAQAMRNHMMEMLYDMQPPCWPPGRITKETDNAASRPRSDVSEDAHDRRFSKVKKRTVKSSAIRKRSNRAGPLASIKLRITRFVREWGPKCLEHGARFVVLYSEKSIDKPVLDRPDVIPFAEDVANGRFGNLSQTTKKKLFNAIRVIDRDHPTLLKPKEPKSDDADDDANEDANDDADNSEKKSSEVVFDF